MSEKIWLALICGIIVVLTALKIVDEETLQEKSVSYKVRKTIIISVGNVLAVLFTYHGAVYYGVDVNFALTLGAVLGYIGGDALFKRIEQALEIWLKRKAGGDD